MNSKDVLEKTGEISAYIKTAVQASLSRDGFPLSLMLIVILSLGRVGSWFRTFQFRGDFRLIISLGRVTYLDLMVAYYPLVGEPSLLALDVIAPICHRLAMPH